MAELLEHEHVGVARVSRGLELSLDAHSSGGTQAQPIASEFDATHVRIDDAISLEQREVC